MRLEVRGGGRNIFNNTGTITPLAWWLMLASLGHVCLYYCIAQYVNKTFLPNINEFKNLEFPTSSSPPPMINRKRTGKIFSRFMQGKYDFGVPGIITSLKYIFLERVRSEC